ELTLNKQLAADTIQSIKNNKKTIRRPANTRDSNKGTGSMSRVHDESTVVFSSSHGGISVIPGFSDEAKEDDDLDLGDEEKNDDDVDADDENDDDNDAETESDEDDIYKYKIHVHKIQLLVIPDIPNMKLK
ncbi:hypothetical protein Tco_1535343, partial [Tanacetum coccineum]